MDPTAAATPTVCVVGGVTGFPNSEKSTTVSESHLGSGTFDKVVIELVTQTLATNELAFSCAGGLAANPAGGTLVSFTATSTGDPGISPLVASAGGVLDYGTPAGYTIATKIAAFSALPSSLNTGDTPSSIIFTVTPTAAVGPGSKISIVAGAHIWNSLSTPSCAGVDSSGSVVSVSTKVMGITAVAAISIVPASYVEGETPSDITFTQTLTTALTSTDQIVVSISDGLFQTNGNSVSCQYTAGFPPISVVVPAAVDNSGLVLTFSPNSDIAAGSLILTCHDNIKVNPGGCTTVTATIFTTKDLEPVTYGGVPYVTTGVGGCGGGVGSGSGGRRRLAGGASTLASSATFDVDVEMMVANALASSKGVASGSPQLGHRRKLSASGKYAVIENFDGKACTSTKNYHQLVHLDECITFATLSGTVTSLAYIQIAVNKVGMSVWMGTTCTGTAATTNLVANSTCAAALNTMGQNATAISPYTLKDSDVMFDLYVTVPTRDLQMSASLLSLFLSTHGSRAWACVQIHYRYRPLTAAPLPPPTCLPLRSHTRTGTPTALAWSTPR